MNKTEITHDTPLSFLTVGQFMDLVKHATQSPTTEKPTLEVYGIDTLKQITGYSRATVYSKTSRNEIPHFKRDGKLYFRHSEILAWLTENRVKTKAEFSQKMDEKLKKE
jgi:predicted DNA-binding transcriptional regulator AlpA